jgi:Histidine kinase
MTWPFRHKAEANFWLNVFALYALAEACIQLLYFIILNNFGTNRISILEIHLVMWFFQCLLIGPIWWVAWTVRKKNLVIQIIVNLAFYVLYSFFWFGPVQEAINYLYNNIQELTRSVTDRQVAYLDRGNEYSYLNYQLLKHAFRLSWFFLAAYFYNYRLEEKKRIQLAVANKELQLKLLKWHLNPAFYFKTISHLRQVAAESPVNTTGPILQLAKVMEYVIYEAKEKLIDVKKEIHFLHNYIRLINQQPGNHSIFELEVTGEYEKLKIAPLLLVGFIDKIPAAENTVEKNLCGIHLQFSGQEMQLGVNGDPGKMLTAALLPDDALYQRLKEVYPGRFSVNNTAADAPFKLNLVLNEQ